MLLLSLKKYLQVRVASYKCSFFFGGVSVLLKNKTKETMKYFAKIAKKLFHKKEHDKETKSFHYFSDFTLWTSVASAWMTHSSIYHALCEL